MNMNKKWGKGTLAHCRFEGFLSREGFLLTLNNRERVIEQQQ